MPELHHKDDEQSPPELLSADTMRRTALKEPSILK
jgi:hypothetical protein